MTTTLIFWEILTFVVLVAVLLLLLPRILRFRNRLHQLLDGSDDPRGNQKALEMLDQRYADGEISREEYLTIQDDIMRKQNA